MREVTLLLRRLGEGDTDAADELLPLVYDRLHELARGYMSDERRDHTLQPTALVHEAWLRLERAPELWAGEPTASDRARFLAVSARAMRRVLVDHARGRGANKRGGGAERVPLDEVVERLEPASGDLASLDEALEGLAGVDPKLAQLVELRFFAGFSVREAADVLGLSVRQVERSWTAARAWLLRELGRGVDVP